jgi:tetratricopeptide (TPR) repeat protein
MRRFVLPLLATLALAAPALAGAPDETPALKCLLQHGVDHADLGEVMQARARFALLARLAPNAALPPYWTAVADWRATAMLLNGPHPDRKRARLQCDAGIAAATRAFELDPRFGEALALKASLVGMSAVFFAPDALMQLGAQMEADLSRAVTLSGDDPRVSLFEGIHALHKPEFVGGGPRVALGKLTRAIEQFAGERSGDPAAPDWGRDDACLWAGRAAMKLGDPAGAVRYFTAALEANPENAWVRATLLPEAQRAAADSARGAAR